MKTGSRLLGLILAGTMALCLVACASSADTSEETTLAAETETTEESIEETSEEETTPAEETSETDESASDIDESTVTLICDGTASYKLEAEERDADTFDGHYVLSDYFEGGTQEDMMEGIRSLISSGKASVNGITLPSSISDMTASDDGTYSYITNGSAAFTLEESASDEEVVEGGLSAIETDVKAAGTNVIFELDENGYATSMNIFTTRGALVDEIVDNGDGTSTLIADGTEYSIGEGEDSVPVVFPNENVDQTISVGDICVCYEDASGWHLVAADGLEGYLRGGADHEDYIFEDLEGNTHYLQDADMYARAFATQNRPGGFVNTQNNFELTDKDYVITAWFVPGTADTEKPMLIGFTTGESAWPRLSDAIEYAENIADNAVVASSREEAGEGVDWVEDQSTIDDLKDAIAEAQAVYDDAEATSSEVDGAVYNLHLAIWGSMSDISAVYMGTAQEGFFDIANPDVEKAAPVEVK